MEYRIPYKDFLKTFTKKQLSDIKNYELVKNLHKKGFSKTKIKKKVNTSEDKLYQWRYTNIKPPSLKTLKEAKERGYFKPISFKKLEWLAYFIGYNLGDGNISRNLCNTWFYGVNYDLENIKKILIKFNVKPVIYTYKINNGKMAIHDRVFSRFLVCFGAVSGDKTKQKVEIPEWILNSKKASKLKLGFLQGYFDSELNDIKLIKDKKLAYQSLKIYNSKHKDCIEDGKLFLNQIISILKEFNIYSSEVKFDRAYFRSRDKSNMQQLYFVIYSNYINLYNLIKNVGFLFNSKRRQSGLEVLDKIKDNAKNESYKITKYKEVLQLRKKGLSAYKIAKKLDVKVHLVKSWVYHNRKPVLYNFIKRA